MKKNLNLFYMINAKSLDIDARKTSKPTRRSLREIASRQIFFSLHLLLHNQHLVKVAQNFLIPNFRWFGMENERKRKKTERCLHKEVLRRYKATLLLVLIAVLKSCSFLYYFSFAIDTQKFYFLEFLTFIIVKSTVSKFIDKKCGHVVCLSTL